jgi:hypothetical protein
MVRRTALALASVAAACGTGPPGAESQRSDAPPGGAAPAIDATDTVAAVPLTCEDLHETILRVPPTRRALAAAFGAPDSVHASAEPNRHVPGATDSLFTVYYPGMVLDIRTPQDARDMATYVRLEDDRYLAFPGIGIGTSRERLEDVLGTATQSDAETLIWDCGTAVEQPVTFHLADGRVAAITIAYYVD